MKKAVLGRFTYVATLFSVAAIFAFSLFLPTSMRADTAPCGVGALSASGYFFTNYESTSYSPDGYLAYHFQNAPQYTGRAFTIGWHYADDECSPLLVQGGTTLFLGRVSNWSIRFTSSTHLDVWDDENETIVQGFDVPSLPAYTRVTFVGNIDGSASTFTSQTLNITQGGHTPAFTNAVDTPPGCTAISADGYYFDSSQNAEYVNGLLRVHLRLKTSYNDGRTFHARLTGADGDCNLVAASSSPALFPAFTPYIRYYSFRMTSPTHWILWDDENNTAFTCADCSGDLPSTAAYVSFSANIDGSVSTLHTTPFAPQGSNSNPSTPPDPPPPDPKPTTAPATCCDNVLFLPGVEGSILAEGSETLWPPQLFHVKDSFKKLSFNADGTPADSNIVVRGLMNTFDIKSAGVTLHSIPAYQPFSAFLDSFTALDPVTGTSTIHSWKALPYDWRYSPDDIVKNGVLTPSGTVDLVREVEKAAADSYTGKITLVAHSYGGLVGKALINALEKKGEAGFVTSYIMVASPQLGTPLAIGGILHGEGSSLGAQLGGFTFPLVTKAQARALSGHLESAYDLLPSSEYFNRVPDPVIQYDPKAPFGTEWVSVFGGSGVKKFVDLVSFMTADLVPHPDPNTIGFGSMPTIADSGLLSNAQGLHGTYDSFVFPSSMRVVQIAGWGLDTVKGIRYVTRHGILSYDPLWTSEGDNTVVYPSAIASNGEKYFFNLFDFNRNTSANTNHASLLNTVPVDNVLKNILTENSSSQIQYISSNKPPISANQDRLVVSTHSPVTLGVTDANGNYTGVTPGQDPAADILLTTTDIPGSSYFTFGDGEYVSLPEGGKYTFTFDGTDTGPATVLVQALENEETKTLATFTDISVSLATHAAFTVSEGVPSPIVIGSNTTLSDEAKAVLPPQQTQTSPATPFTPLSIGNGAPLITTLITKPLQQVLGEFIALPPPTPQNKIAPTILLEVPIPTHKERIAPIQMPTEATSTQQLAAAAEPGWYDKIVGFIKNIFESFISLFRSF